MGKKIKIMGLFIILFLIFGCKTTHSEIIFNTVCTITLHGDTTVEKVNSRGLLRSAFKRLQELEQQLDSMNQESLLNKQSKNSNGLPIKYSGVQANLLAKSIKEAEFFNGAFDPTIRPLVSLWDIGNTGIKVPPIQEIKKRLNAVGYEKIKLTHNIQNSSITVSNYPNLFGLDFGAVAKGFAADEVSRIITKGGISKAVINIGGNVTLIGKHPEERLWRIGIQNPFSQRGNNAVIIQLKDNSASTSGIYERYFFDNEKRYHHLLDPRTGFPAENDFASVTVISKNAMTADICSTGLFVTGGEKAFKMAEERKDIEAIFILKDKTVLSTSGIINQTEIEEGLNFKLKKISFPREIFTP